MKERTISLFMFLGVIGCKDNPYIERAEPIKKNELNGVIIFPTHQAVLSSNSFRDGVSVKASVTSDVPLSDCRWLIQAENQQENLFSGLGVIDGANCQIEERMDGDKFIDGKYYLQVHAENRDGLKLSDAVSNFQVFRQAPIIDVIWPGNEEFLAEDNIKISGTLKNVKDIKELKVSFHGIGVENQHLKENAKVPLKTDSNDWQISLGQELIAGEYAVDLIVIDIYGNELKLPTRHLTIDNMPPTILGALDAVPQNLYAQETINYRQRFIEAEGNPRYIIEPTEKAAAINWQGKPTIYRWLARLNDWNTAPSYTIRASDDKKLREVRYKIDTKCAALEEAEKIAASQDDTYDIRITQGSTDCDLVHSSEKYCLSIWAIDQAGNASNHKAEFILKVIAPPLSVDINTKQYKASGREDDITWIGPPIKTLFRGNRSPIELKKNLVIGHAIISNPFHMPLAASLKLQKPMELKINNYQYNISPEIIDIKYYSYDLRTNEISSERALNDGGVAINGNETILAKFILAKEVPLNGIGNIDSRFWQSLSLKVGFAKKGNDRPMVDGLMLMTRELNLGIMSHEYAVSWGDEHVVRSRSAPRIAR